jgi:polysaccharide export outer membrane protein
MKNKQRSYLAILLIGVAVFSCRSAKDFTYLQNATEDQKISGGQNEIKEYKIKPYDNLYVSIKTTLNPEINQLFEGTTSMSGYQAGTDQMYGSPVSQYINGYQVDSIGNITLPILGMVAVDGLTLKQAKDQIQKKALEYLKEPTIKIKLLSFKYFVDGEVKSPGVYYSYSEKLNILEAIANARGVTENAKIEKTVVVRETSKGTDIIHLDLTDKSLFKSEAYYLQPNDMVYIEPGKNKKLELNSTSYSLFLTTLTTVLVILNFFK